MGEGKIQVMIAEDSEESCGLVKSYLERISGIEVCAVATDGEDALSKIYSLRPDIVLLDIMMPKLDGIAVLRKLKENPPGGNVRVIVLTAINNEAIASEAFSLGACYCLLKPTNFETLKDTIYFAHRMKLVAPEREKAEAEDSVAIRKLLLNLKIPPHLLGYTYILDAVAIMLEGAYSGNLSKQVYSRIAIERRTNAECVESAMRSAIKEAANKNSAAFEKMFSDSGRGEINRPSNLKFLTKVSEELRLH